MSDAPETRTSRTLLCLVADEAVISTRGATLRYLLLGMMDEPIDTILVAPEHERLQKLVGGPTRLITYTPAHWPFDIWENRRVVALIQNHVDTVRHDGPIIVHALSAGVGPISARLAEVLGAEFLLTVASLEDAENDALAHWGQALDGVIALSQIIHQAVAGSWLRDKPSHLVNLGVPATNAPIAFVAGHRAPALLYAGPLTEDAGLHVLLRSLNRTLHKHPELLTFILGKGPAERDLRRLAGDLGVAANVVFPGKLDDWPVAMEHADLFCLPHPQREIREEVIHALAAGLTVIAAQGNPYDCLVDRRTAVICRPHDEGALAAACIALLDDKHYARQLAKDAQAHVRQHFSAGNMVAAHVRIYNGLASRNQTIPITTA